MYKSKSNKTLLSDEIATAYNNLVDVVDRIPNQQFYEKTIEVTGEEPTSVADSMAYQIGWGTLLIGWYNAGIAKKDVVMPGDDFTTWDYVGIAKHFSEKYRYQDKSTTLEAFYSVVAEIIAIVKKEEKKNGNLNRLGIWSWCTLGSGKQWPLSKWVEVNTVAPYKRARLLISSAIPNSLPHIRAKS